MTFLMSDTCRERTRRLLTSTTQPLTVATVAEQLGTTPTQAGRALRQLEAEGAATRRRGRPSSGWGWTPDQWKAAPISPSSADAHAATSRTR